MIRASVPAQQMDSAEAVRSYKVLAEMERAFRSMKSIDLHIRPIHQHLEGRVRAHIFSPRCFVPPVACSVGILPQASQSRRSWLAPAAILAAGAARSLYRAGFSNL